MYVKEQHGAQSLAARRFPKDVVIVTQNACGLGLPLQASLMKVVNLLMYNVILSG